MVRVCAVGAVASEDDADRRMGWDAQDAALQAQIAKGAADHVHGRYTVDAALMLIMLTLMLISRMGMHCPRRQGPPQGRRQRPQRTHSRQQCAIAALSSPLLY